MARTLLTKIKAAVTTAAPVPAKNSVITDDIVAKRAHEIWEKRGRPPGRSKAHWLQAERELKAAQKPTK
jgi:hypothetical protein